MLAGLLGLAGCDAEDHDAELDDAAEEDLEARDWGCAYYASSPPAVDNTYLPDGGKANGGCDLHVTAHSIPQAEGSVRADVRAYADAPVSEMKARLWGRHCAGIYCGPWSIVNFSWDDLDFGIGYCDEAETVPCKYRVQGHALLPYNKLFNQFRVGTSVIDENGTSVYVSVARVE